MPSSDYTERLEVEKGCSRTEYLGENLVADNDFLIEQILENVNNTPLGQVLKRIASLPEVRQEKVLDVRRSLADGRYDLNDRLDMALDRVLEELTG
ncbi:MAG: flagellar biosynthesis anti-sigma factor FlgM [Phycisphaerales bacterium]|jgi:hypothetical protein